MPSKEFDAAVQRWWIDDLALVDCVCGPKSGTWQRRHIADTDGEFFVVMMNLVGRETISHGDDSVRIGAGDVAFWDSSLPARFAVHERLSTRSLIVPFSAIDEVGGKPWAVPRNDGRSAFAVGAAPDRVPGYPCADPSGVVAFGDRRRSQRDAGIVDRGSPS
ncbi:AraC-like ligand-binding domain-containing protein [Mycobacterium sp. C31M]